MLNFVFLACSPSDSFPVCRGAGIHITWLQLCWSEENVSDLMGDRIPLLWDWKWWCPKREVSRKDKLCAPGLVWTGVRAWRSPPGSHSSYWACAVVVTSGWSARRTNPEPNSDQLGEMKIFIRSLSLGIPNTGDLCQAWLWGLLRCHMAEVRRSWASVQNWILIHMMMGAIQVFHPP